MFKSASQRGVCGASSRSTSILSQDSSIDSTRLDGTPASHELITDLRSQLATCVYNHAQKTAEVVEKELEIETLQEELEKTRRRVFFLEMKNNQKKMDELQEKKQWESFMRNKVEKDFENCLVDAAVSELKEESQRNMEAMVSQVQQTFQEEQRFVWHAILEKVLADVKRLWQKECKRGMQQETEDINVYKCTASSDSNELSKVMQELELQDSHIERFREFQDESSPSLNHKAQERGETCRADCGELFIAELELLDSISKLKQGLWDGVSIRNQELWDSFSMLEQDLWGSVSMQEQ